MITSSDNQHVKQVRRLGQSAAYRREQGFYVLESIKHLTTVHRRAPALILRVLVEETVSLSVVPDVGCPVERVATSVFRRLKTTAHSQGVISIIRQKAPPVLFDQCRYLIIADGIQSPHNLGAMIRSVTAFMIDTAILLHGPTADPYHPDSVRATAGTLDQVPMQRFCLDDVARLQQWPWYGFDPKATQCITTIAHQPKAGFIFGSEGQGISDELSRLLAPTQQRIPIQPHVESLNVAVATGIVCWQMRCGESMVTPL